MTPLARSAQINYRKLAKGPITANSRLMVDKAAVVAALDADGKAAFDVAVELTDGQGVLVADMTVNWHLRKN